MNDMASLMQMAQAFAPPAAARGADQLGPRFTLALIAAAADKDCTCTCCGHLRAVVQLMEQAIAPTSATSPRSIALT